MRHEGDANNKHFRSFNKDKTEPIGGMGWEHWLQMGYNIDIFAH